jgi:hypothetical protein
MPEYTGVRAELSKALEEAVEVYVAKTGEPDAEEVLGTVDNIGRQFAIELLRDYAGLNPKSTEYADELRRTKERLIDGALQTALS